MQSHHLRLGIIVGSTREGRFATTVARWFVDQARKRDDFDLDLIDLAETPLPPVLPAGPNADADAFTARIEAADAFVVITPEYNHSYPAALKHAIDFGKSEWAHKPIGFVSYGGMSGGIRAVEHLRQVFPELHAVTVRDTVSFHNVRERFGQDGQPLDSEGCNTAASIMLAQLAWWAAALRTARAA